MTKLGRRTKLNKARKEAIIEAIKLGATYEIAAEAAGISKATLYNWMKRGEEDSSGNFSDFLDALKKAEAAAAIGALKTINVASSDGDWKAAAYLLERRHNYKRDSQHLRSDQITEKPKEETVATTPIEIMNRQAEELRIAIKKAESAESWQAYSALQRQLLSVLVQIRQISTEDDNTFEDLTDEQILGEISTMVSILPPVLKQRLVDEIAGLESPNIKIFKR
jgi:transposase-like protein